MKYKVGDVVMVKKPLPKDNGCEVFVNDDMEKFAGQEVTISKINDGFYSIKENDSAWIWTDSMFTKPHKKCSSTKKLKRNAIAYLTKALSDDVYQITNADVELYKAVIAQNS